MIAITVCGNILLLSIMMLFRINVLDRPGSECAFTKLRGQKVVINELTEEKLKWHGTHGHEWWLC